MTAVGTPPQPKSPPPTSARTLYQSLRATSDIADHVQILPAHGAGSACGKSLGAVPNSVMGYERKFNAPFREALTAPEDQFVNNILAGQPEPPLYFARMKRDNKLGPALLRDGKLPSPERISADQLGEWQAMSGMRKTSPTPGLPPASTKCRRPIRFTFTAPGEPAPPSPPRISPTEAAGWCMWMAPSRKSPHP